MAIGKFYVELAGDSVSGARVLSLAVICAKTFFHLHHLSFIPLCAPTSALRAPPSKGRRDRYTQNAPHSRPFLWKGLSSVARRGWLPRMLKMRFPRIAIPTTFGHRPIYIRGEAATFIPNFSFLILHFSFEQCFHPQSKDAPWANPEPIFISLF